MFGALVGLRKPVVLACSWVVSAKRCLAEEWVVAKRSKGCVEGVPLRIVHQLPSRLLHVQSKQAQQSSKAVGLSCNCISCGDSGGLTSVSSPPAKTAFTPRGKGGEHLPDGLSALRRFSSLLYCSEMAVILVPVISAGPGDARWLPPQAHTTRRRHTERT